jgi:hypothetical protein
MSLLTPLPFNFVVDKSISQCVEITQAMHELNFLRASYHVKIKNNNENDYDFSIEQPRRTIPILVIGHITSVSEDKTQINGEVKAEFQQLILTIIGALVICGLVVLSSKSLGALCFAFLGSAILSVGVGFELLDQRNAKTQMIQRIKQRFEFDETAKPQ